jgi:preprotein translocase subunit YajC
MTFTLYSIATALTAMTPPEGQAEGPLGSLSAFVPIILIFVIFYFLLIRPQQKRQKEHRNMVESLKKGDQVVTAGGIHGTVTSVAENLATVEIAQNVKIKVTKSSIAVVKREDQPN